MYHMLSIDLDWSGIGKCGLRAGSGVGQCEGEEESNHANGAEL